MDEIGNLNIVYIETGAVRFWESIAQLRKYYKGMIHVVIPKEALEDKRIAINELIPYTIEELESYYPLRAFRKLSPGGWVAAETERLFLAEAFCRSVSCKRRSSYLFIRGDTLLYDNPRHYRDILRKAANKGVLLCEGLDSEEFSTSLVYVHQVRSLRLITEGILKLMQGKLFKKLYPVFPGAGKMVWHMRKKYPRLISLLPASPSSSNSFMFGSRLFGNGGRPVGYTQKTTTDRKGRLVPELVSQVSGKRYTYASMSK
jgi:hypothetical protein